MSILLSTPERSTPGTSPAALPPPSQASKRQRVLACVLCQQRKVKCDRKFPCSNCIKAKVQCIPATLSPRRRKRRFPERELLERLRKYEGLLRQNNIKFEPLHKDSSGEPAATTGDDGSDSDGDQRETPLSPTTKSERGNETKY